MNKIIAALAMLVATDDSHWTTDGLPRIDTVRSLAGDENISRQDINNAAPGFSRTNNVLPGAQAAQAGASDAATNTAPNAAPAGDTPALQLHTGGNDGQVQQEGTEGEDNGGAVSQRAALEAELAVAQDRLAEIEQAFIRGEAVRSEARAEVDRIVTQIDALPKEPAHAPFLGYLASQARELEQRAALRRQLAESNVDLNALSSITAASPLDRAMTRKRGYGQQRPAYVPKG